MVRLRVLHRGDSAAAPSRSWRWHFWRICFPRSEPTTFPAGVCGIMLLEIAVEMGIPVAVMIVLCGTGFAVYPRSRHGQIQGPKSAFAGCNHRDCVCIRQSIFPCRFPAILSYSVFCSVAGSPEHPLRWRRPAKCDRKRLLRLSGSNINAERIMFDGGERIFARSMANSATRDCLLD